MAGEARRYLASAKAPPPGEVMSGRPTPARYSSCGLFLRRHTLFVVALRQFRHPQCDRWLATLPAPVAAEIASGIDYRCEHGRGAVLPDVRHRIQTSRHFPDMSEIHRPQHRRPPIPDAGSDLFRR
jgi:hypothetical protein